MDTSSLLCFESFFVRDRFFQLLRWRQKEGASMLVENNHIDTYEDNAQVCRSCVIRVAGGKAAFLREVQLLATHFAQVVVFHGLIRELDTNAIGPLVSANPSVGDIERAFSIVLSNEQRERYTQLIVPPLPRPAIFQTTFQQRLIAHIQEGQEVTLEAIFNAPSEDDLLEQALQASRDHEEARQQSLARTRVRLQEGWETVLRDAEPLVEGQPLCIVCLCNRASICLVECGHQVMCDACVRVMWTRADVKHNCPVCQAECAIITRPITSQVAETTKKRRKKIK